nr:type III-A CRISPR-associated protein Csm2 [Candidatus Sigynarchaeota archaeon]
MSKPYQKPQKGQDRGQGSSALVQEILRSTDAILKGSEIEKFIELSEKFGKKCADDDVSTSQIRSIFNMVRRLPDKFTTECKNQLNLIRPKLAYQRGRFEELQDLQTILDALIKAVKDDKTLVNFKKFFEAIICYHKANKGEE